MHAMALGVAQHVAGNALELLVYHGPRTTKQNLDKVWGLILESYKENKSPVQIRELVPSI
jgi:hypothetical protein